MNQKIKRFLCGIARFGLILPLVVILFICRDCLSGYNAPKTVEIECPTATDMLGHTMPAYKRLDKVGVYLIQYCDMEVRLDTVKNVNLKNK